MRSCAYAVALGTLAATLALGCAPTLQEGAGTTDTTLDGSQSIGPVTSVLRGYEAALNRGDVDAIVSLYAPDAVFMAQHRSPAVGHAQIESAYREIFETIDLDITFAIDEVVIVSPTVAYARTRSEGKATILDADAQVAEGNQELFVLVRTDVDSEWQIGRYIFSTTQPRS